MEQVLVMNLMLEAPTQATEARPGCSPWRFTIVVDKYRKKLQKNTMIVKKKIIMSINEKINKNNF